MKKPKTSPLPEGLTPVSFKVPTPLKEQMDERLKKDEALLRPHRAHSLTGITIQLWKGYLEGLYQIGEAAPAPGDPALEARLERAKADLLKQFEREVKAILKKKG